MARKKKENELIVPEKENILLESRVEAEQIKKELEKYVDEKVNKVFVDELDKANRKLLREKSKKIFIKNIVIILLLLFIGFLVYLLYSNNYFDKFFNKNNTEIKENIDTKEEKTDVKEDKEVKEEPKKEITLDDLKKEYAHLLDNYVLHEKSNYLDDLYKGELTNALKNYLTLNTIDFNSLVKEDDYQIIANDTFKLAYEKLFSSDYVSETFDYNGNGIRYVNPLTSYITAKLLTKEESNIKREIKDIHVLDGKVTITTIEGMVKDNKLYNIMTQTEIENYKNDSLLNYSDSLNQVSYVFKDNKLISLTK